MDMQVLSFRVK